MAEFTYEDLRRVQRLEKASPKLSEIPEEFYNDAFAFQNELKEKYEKSNSLEDLRVLENVKKIIQDIFERREQKIALRSIRALRINEDDSSSLVSWEKELYSKLKSVHSGFREKVLEKEDIPEIEEKTEINSRVRISKKIPEFVSTDGVKYGPFEEGELIDLPEEVAQLLVGKDYAKMEEVTNEDTQGD